MHKTFMLIATTSAAMTPLYANTPSEAAKAWEEGRQADAVVIWQNLGAKGDKDALYNLGQSARTGRGMAKDTAKAVAYYRQALKLGHPKAGEVLGLMLFADVATKNEGLALLQQAAATGSPRANFAIALTELPLTTEAKGLAALRDRLKLALAGGIEAAKEPLTEIEQKLAQMEVRVTAPALVRAATATPVKIVDVTPAAHVPANTKSWRVSLGDYESNTIAMVKWMRISARQRLKAYPVFIEPKSPAYRLSFGNFGTEADAQKLCSLLIADKTKCSIFKI